MTTEERELLEELAAFESYTTGDKDFSALLTKIQQAGADSLFLPHYYSEVPLQVKQALTGYGKADKKQIQYMVKNLLKCGEVPRPDDAADALAIAMCHINTKKMSAIFAGNNK